MPSQRARPQWGGKLGTDGIQRGFGLRSDLAGAKRQIGAVLGHPAIEPSFFNGLGHLGQNENQILVRSQIELQFLLAHVSRRQIVPRVSAAALTPMRGKTRHANADRDGQQVIDGR